MPTITGTLTDFGLNALTAYSPEIIFTPSSAVASTTRLMAARPIRCVPASDGTFTVGLATTVDTRPESWYTIRIQWLNGEDVPVGVDFPDWKLKVGTVAAELIDLLRIPANPAQVWIDELEPENPTPGLWWLNPTTGDLYEWSN